MESALAMGRDILSKCHPDALTTMKHWLSILQARWDDVVARAEQREKKLSDQLFKVRTEHGRYVMLLTQIQLEMYEDNNIPLV